MGFDGGLASDSRPRLQRSILSAFGTRWNSGMLEENRKLRRFAVLGIQIKKEVTRVQVVTRCYKCLKLFWTLIEGLTLMTVAMALDIWFTMFILFILFIFIPQGIDTTVVRLCDAQGENLSERPDALIPTQQKRHTWNLYNFIIILSQHYLANNGNKTVKNIGKPQISRGGWWPTTTFLPASSHCKAIQVLKCQCH